MSNSSYPCTALVTSKNKVITIFGPHIHIVGLVSGELLVSTKSIQGDILQKHLEAGPIRCSELDSLGKYLATVSDDKLLRIWNTNNLELLNQRELPKKPTAIRFTANSQTILVADKFGDVFEYPLHPGNDLPGHRPRQRDTLSSHENPSDGQLILGHVSLLTSLILTKDEKHIITADRDEHIRISKYPQGYDIEMFCLGHTKFVSCIHIPSFEPSVLVSGGGDPMLKVWKWLTGQLICDIDIWSTVEPFIRVKPCKRKALDSDQGGQEDSEPTVLNKKRRKKRGKANAVVGEPVQASADKKTADVNMMDTTGDEQEDLEKEGPPQPVFVLHKISSLDSAHGQYLIFSVVGSSALFGCCFRGSETPQSDIFSFDLGAPILDFNLTETNIILVTLDDAWIDLENGEVPLLDSRKFQVLSLRDGRFEECHEYCESLTTLNTKCLVEATPADIKALDLYQPLSSMPKWCFPDFEVVDEQSIKTRRQKEGPTKRELGRLRAKRALLDHISGTSDDIIPNQGSESKRIRHDPSQS